MKNIYYSQKVSSEQNLYEDIVIESLKIYGQDVYYLPREIVNEDTILNEDVPSKFGSKYIVEMYIENIEGFGGSGDLFSKFGVEIRDQATFIVARRRWRESVQKNSQILIDSGIMRPREGDLIYLPLTKSLFEIAGTDNDRPFYQLNNLPTFQMTCELFEYSSEDFDTGVEEIDDIEKEYAYIYKLGLTRDSSQELVNFEIDEEISHLKTNGITMSGEVMRWQDSDNMLFLGHVGGDSGDYSEFEIGALITGLESSAEGIVSSITELNQLSSNEDNQDYENLSFQDFSETNPFGDDA